MEQIIRKINGDTYKSTFTNKYRNTHFKQRIYAWCTIYKNGKKIGSHMTEKISTGGWRRYGSPANPGTPKTKAQYLNYCKMMEWKSA